MIMRVIIYQKQKKEFIEALSKITGVANEQQFSTYQYLIRALNCKN